MHEEQPAHVEPQEAADSVEAQLVSFISAGMFLDTAAAAQAAGAHSDDEELTLERIFELIMNREPPGAQLALEQGLSLQACRRSLEESGHDWRLLSGAKIFVHPWQYRQVMRALNGRELPSSRVIVAESLEHLVEESLAGIGRGAWARSRTELALAPYSDMEVGSAPAMPSTSQIWEEFEVRRTFVCEVRRRATERAAQSTTQARSNIGQNPRQSTADW